MQVAATLRDEGFAGPITILGDEPHPPYQRPPLSKAFLKGAIEPERLHLKTSAFYADRGIELMLGRRAGRIDLRNRRIDMADGGEVPFAKLVIATGTRPRIPALPGGGHAQVFSLRSIADVEAMRPAAAGVSRFAIVGGGYIGLEVAAVLREMGRDVTVIEAEDRLLKRVTPLRSRTTSTRCTVRMASRS